MINHHLTKIAERERFILLQPQALVGNSSGIGDTGWDAHNLLPWNDVSFINSIIDTLYQKGLIDMSRIYVTGMSNGGFMTFTVAEKLQDRIADIRYQALDIPQIWISMALRRYGSSSGIIPFNRIPLVNLDISDIG